MTITEFFVGYLSSILAYCFFVAPLLNGITYYEPQFVPTTQMMMPTKLDCHAFGANSTQLTTHEKNMASRLIRKNMDRLYDGKNPTAPENSNQETNKPKDEKQLSAGSFCEECGICRVIRATRALLYSASRLAPASLQHELDDPEDFQIWDPVNEHTERLRQAILKCPWECPPSTVALTSGNTYPFRVIRNPRVFDPQMYLFYFPHAYTCPMSPETERVCVSAHYWLRGVSRLNLGDTLLGNRAPPTTVCLTRGQLERLPFENVYEMVAVAPPPR